jgi:hypothetical protein
LLKHVGELGVHAANFTVVLLPFVNLTASLVVVAVLNGAAAVVAAVVRLRGMCIAAAAVLAQAAIVGLGRRGTRDRAAV